MKKTLLPILALFLMASCGNNGNNNSTSNAGSSLASKKTKEMLYPIEENERLGFIDASGNVVIRPQFEDLNTPRHEEPGDVFYEGLACVALSDDRWGFIDKSGQFVINPQFDNVDGYIGELVIVGISDRAAYIDRTGRIVWMEQ